MPTYHTPKRATAYQFYVGLADQANTKLLKANPTIAAGDFQVSKDGGAFANLATLPSANPASSAAVMIDLSAAEMTADNVVVRCVDAAGAEWCDLLINIQPTARQLDDLAFPLVSGRGIDVNTAGSVSIITGFKKNQAIDNFHFVMTDSTTHNPAPGKTVTVSRAIDSDTVFVAGALSAVSEMSDGAYRVSLAAADTNGNIVTVKATAPGCDPIFLTFILEP